MKLLSVLFFFIGFSVYSQTVYYTPSGEKYHLATCRSVKNTASKTTVEKAVARGLTACKICKASAGGSESSSSSSSVLGFQSATKSTAGTLQESQQCKGRTKAGNRCKHLTRIGNGYCHQHQP